MIERREVRVADSFFAELEDQLGSQRGPNGQPSVTDFIVLDLPVVAERFAASFDELPEAIAGVPSIRMCIGSAAPRHTPSERQTPEPKIRRLLTWRRVWGVASPKHQHRVKADHAEGLEPTAVLTLPTPDPPRG